MKIQTVRFYKKTIACVRVIIAFQTAAIRDVCLRENITITEFSEESSKALFACLSDLRAAETLSDLPAFPNFLNFNPELLRASLKYPNGPDIEFAANDRKARPATLTAMGDTQYIRIDRVGHIRGS